MESSMGTIAMRERHQVLLWTRKQPGTEPGVETDRIKRETRCRRGFECYKAGVGVCPQAKDIGIESNLGCLQEAQRLARCGYSVRFGQTYLCRCPLQLHVATKRRRPTPS